MFKSIVVTGVILSGLACGSAQAGDRLGAVLGGAAVGAVGGVILGSALSAHAQPAPPPPVYFAPPPPPPVRTVIVRDPFDDQAARLHDECDDGDRHACIRFGILIGAHREHVAEWRRTHPDYFSYE